MSEVLMVPDCNRNNNSNLDSAVLLSMLNNANNGGGWNNGGWMWIIFLFFLEPLMRGGFFGNNGFGNGFGGGFNGLGYTDNLINNSAGREMLMQAIQGNGSQLQNLANMLNTNVDFVKQAICGVQNSITQLSGTVGLSGQQTINAIQQGNMSIASQLADCCCTIRTSILESNYQNQIANLQQTQTISSDINNVRSALTQGFCDTAYSFRDQTCQLGAAIKDSTQTLKDSNTAQTASIIAKLDAMQLDALNNKIESQREVISQLKNANEITESRIFTQQAIAQAVAPIAAQVNEIKNSQPNTVTVPYYPFQITPNVNYNPYGYGNGCGCGSCQNQFWF